MSKILVNYIYIGSNKRLEKLKFFKPFSFENITSIGFDAETELVELIDKVIAPEGSGRSVILVNANKREASNHIFYDLEYKLNLNEQERHELATVVLDRGTLYTFAVGTNEERWNKVDDIFSNVIESFNFLI